MNTKEKQAIKNLELKIHTLTHYGNGECKCVQCGYKDVRALSIDHIDNNGSAHRKKLGHGRIYRWLVDNDYPDGYQTLCMNCQWIKQARYRKQTLPEKYRNNLTKKVRNWVLLRDMAFNMNDVTSGLFVESREKPKLNVILFRLCKEGLIQHRYYKDSSVMKGCYLVTPKRVKVFG